MTGGKVFFFEGDLQLVNFVVDAPVTPKKKKKKKVQDEVIFIFSANFTSTVKIQIKRKVTNRTSPWCCFVMLYKVVRPFDSGTSLARLAISLKAIEQLFPVVLFIMLCKVVPSAKFWDEILKCDHSNKCH